MDLETANKDFGHLAKMLSDWAALKKIELDNPFVKLRFEVRRNKNKTVHPPFSRKHVADVLLAPGALDGLNDEARDIFLMTINTGARPSEITGAPLEDFVLDHNVPHLRIRENGREVKVAHTERDIPLLGISLEAARRIKDRGGIGQYWDNADGWPSNLSGGDVGNRVIHTLNAEGISSYADAAQYFQNQTTFEPFEQQIFSEISHPISNVNDTPTGGVTIFGAATLRETLTSDISSLADPDGLGSLSYQWLRDGSTISNATNESYTLTEADVGSEISLLVSYTDDQGTLETVTSGATSPVVGELVLFGNRQDNVLIGGSFNDRLVGRAGDDTLSGNKGDDILLGGLGADTAAGGAGTDTLKGNGGSDRLVGNGGNDLVLGGGGRDSLLGGGGNDTLSGGSGHDILQGQRGHDEVTGGGGRDTFVFNRGDGADTITDFELGIDHIQIGRGASRFGQLDFEQVGDDVLVSFRNVEITVENTAVDDLAVSDHFLFV